ncbi:MAG: ABC transporter permease [Trueperaceae bacterium]|nr:ABC transporter permease [Trueperaceae bacterium]MBX3142119.1 ABC transporter permease [Trueperaceae bacterium]MCC6309980.1 ABC transporter permease [Trueperaceae bacterium]MCO5173564.1 ABC transporter permease [Trueperaceae bacterium]MCW5818552.1 ABC transporter permease [Trueperaceae bacterium]
MTGRRFWKALRRNKAALVGFVLFAIFLTCAVFAPALAPANPNRANFSMVLHPPSAAAILGADELGRDILSRILFGARASFLVAASTTAIAAVIGVLLGLLAGYYGGLVDAIIMRAADLLLAFPSFLVALVIVGILGPGLVNVILAVGVLFVPRFVRLMRASVLSVRENEYVEAMAALGSRTPRIIFHHVLPNAMAPIIALTAIVSGEAILIGSGLGFLGLGAQPPLAEWGAMLSEGRVYLTTAPHVAAFPGLAIMGLVVALNLIGDGVRDALDVRL